MPRSYSRASLIVARAFIDDADPEHDAVIDTVRGRQCAVLNFPPQNLRIPGEVGHRFWNEVGHRFWNEVGH